MAISSYSELVTAIQNWSARTDTEVTDRIDEFITLAEDRIFYGDESIGLQPLRVRAMESVQDLTISSQSTALPTGFLESRSFYLNTSTKEDMAYFPPDRFWSSIAGAESSTGLPKIYTIQGDNLVVAPAPDSTYTGKLLSYTKLAGLSSGNTTNWLITNSPGTYLAAVMLELGEYIKDPNEVTYWSQKLAGRINALNNQDEKSKHPSGNLSVKVDRAAPHLDKYSYQRY